MKTITFYSYKGGVGRSLALTNIATRLLEFGKKVCLLDFDLEAPGLHLKLSHLSDKIIIEKGIVDYVYDYINEGLLESDIRNFTVNISDTKNIGQLYLIPAGNTETKTYWKKLSSIDWHDFLYENKNGVAFFLDLKRKIEKQLKPDFLLIDSRTGISEMSGITISLFADDVVIVAANNKENLEGSKKIINSLLYPDHSILGKKIKVIFVLSRIPFTDKPEDKAKEQILISKIKSDFTKYSIDNINVIHSDRDLEINEEIKIGYEKDDSTAQISRDYLRLFEQLAEGELTNSEIKKFNDIKASERFFQRAVQTNSIRQKLELMSKAIELNPDNIQFLIQRGFAYESVGDFDLARKDYENLLGRNLESSVPMNLLGNLELQVGNYDEAEQMFNTILERNANDAFAYYNLGVIYQKRDELDHAITFYTKSIELYPTFASAYNNRAVIYRRIKNLEQALLDIYKALEINSDYAVFYATLAEILADKEDLNGFYLNLEIALKNDLIVIEKIIHEDEFYMKFASEKRFLLLMEKYNILLTT